MSSPAPWILALAVSVAAALGIALLAPLPSVWSAWRPATCMPDHCFCETISPTLIRQPANTISGIAFLAVATVILWLQAQPPAVGDTAAASRVHHRIFAAAVALVGAGTIVYHASLTFWAQTADVLGMYLVVTFVALHSAARIRALAPRTLVTIYAGVNVVLFAGLVLLPELRRYAFAGLVLLTIVLEALTRRRGGTRPRTPYFVAAVGLLAAGGAIWLMDLTRRLCAPDSWLQGHAVWHIAGAAATLLVFRYVTSARVA